MPPRDLRFSTGPAGKPALADNSAGLHFNGSASGDVALLAVTGLGEVGCDVQLHSPLDPGLAQVIERFSPAEQAALARLEPGLRATAFFDCWTRKEAFVKALGCGLSLPLHEFTVSLEPGVPAALLHWDHDPDPSQRWTLTALSVGPGYSAALAVHRPCEVVLRHWVWPD